MVTAGQWRAMAMVSRLRPSMRSCERVLAKRCTSKSPNPPGVAWATEAGQCACLGTEGEMPSYRPELNNDIIWCFGAPTMVYHCSSQVLIGKA